MNNEVVYGILVDSDRYIEQLLQENKQLKEIINKINEIFETGIFEDGCDCEKIEELVKGVINND